MRLPFFVGPSNVSRSPLADPEDCVNFIQEISESNGAITGVVLYPTPGFTEYCHLAHDVAGTDFPMVGPARGMIAIDSVTAGVPSSAVVAVGGPYVYQLPSTVGGSALRVSMALSIAPAEMATDSRRAALAYSGSVGGELLVASGGAVYRYGYDGVAIWSGEVLPASDGIITIGFLDSFFLALDSSSTLRISESFDGTTWDPTQIVQRSNQPDPWVSMFVIHDQIWLFGTRTTDVYFNAGTSPFPFQPLDGVSIQQGIAAPDSVAELDNAPIWLGKNVAGQGMVFYAQGYAPQRVSSFAMEAAIEGYSTIADAEGQSFLVGGHWFYVLTFPTANTSWLYDASTKQWTRVGYWNPQLMRFDAYRVRGHAFYNGAHLVGDRLSGTVYSMSPSLSTEMDGNGIRRARRTPRYAKEGKRLFFKNLEVDAEPGLGLVSGQGSDPQLMLRWSDDGGKTWSNEQMRSIGALGEYGTRAVWDRLGSSRKGRVFELSTSDPVPFRILDASIDLTEGLH